MLWLQLLVEHLKYKYNRIMNELKNVTANKIHACNGASLHGVTVKNGSTCGALSGFYYHGQSGRVTHSWSVYGVNRSDPSGLNLPRGSYNVINSALSDKEFGALVNSAPYEVENQICAMLDYRNSFNFRVNMFKVDSNSLGEAAQRYAGFTCTVFGLITNYTLLTNSHDESVGSGNNHLHTPTNIVGDNKINCLSVDKENSIKLLDNSWNNSGLLAYGEIVGNVFTVAARHPSLKLTYEALGGGGHHKIYTNFPTTEFTCNAGHIFNSADDNICQVFQYDNVIELRSRYGRNNDGWISKNIFWSIYGII